MPLALRPLVRVGYSGRLWAQPPVVCSARERRVVGLAAQVPEPGIESRTVDVILRPDPTLAAQTVDMVEIWGEDVVLKDVPVRYATTGAAAAER